MGAATLDGVVRGGLPEEVTCELRSEYEGSRNEGERQARQRSAKALRPHKRPDEDQPGWRAENRELAGDTN